MHILLPNVCKDSSESMFIIKAQFSEKFPIKANLEKTREFFANMRNFVEMMHGVESIHTDAKGVTFWTIRAEIPVFNSIKKIFSVELVANEPDCLEWLPSPNEKENYLCYRADFDEISERETVVKLSQNIEMRRAKASDLHPMASIAGENLISREMTKAVADRIRTFVHKAKLKLENL